VCTPHQPVLVVPVDVNGQGRLKYAWQKSIGNLVAVTGYAIYSSTMDCMLQYTWVFVMAHLCISINKVVSIYDRHGDFKSQFTLPG